MARPAYDYKILNDNRSSYNLIQHDHHVPQSPLFKPGDSQRYGKNVAIYESDRARQPGADLSPRTFGASYNRIQHDHHVPQSPLYIPGQTPRQTGDQNQGYGQGGPNPLMDESKEDHRQGNLDTNRDRERDRADSPWKAGANTDRNVDFGDVITGNARPSNYQSQGRPRQPAIWMTPTWKENQARMASNQLSSIFDTEHDGEANLLPFMINREKGNNNDKGGDKTDAEPTEEDAWGASEFLNSDRPVLPHPGPDKGEATVEMDGDRESPTRTELQGILKIQEPQKYAASDHAAQESSRPVEAEKVSPRFENSLRDSSRNEGPIAWSSLQEKPQVPQAAANISDPPTPNFNTSHLRFDNPPVGDLRLNLGDGETSKEHDISDFRGNPIPNPPPYKERADDGDVEYRLNSFSSRVNVPSARVRDPRVSGAYAGHAVQGGVRHGGALLFIRFPIGHGENTTVAAQAFQKAKIHDVGGRFLGIAKKVYDFGYSDAQSEALGVFHFPNMDKAVLFFQLDPILRQPDFPAPYGHAEMWIVCNAYLPDNLELFNTFLMSEIELHPGKDKRTFFEDFQVKFEKFLYKNGAMPFVICSYGPHDRRSLRRHAYKPHTIVTAHLFQGLEHLKWLTGDESYCKFRSLHNQMALEKCSIFTLTKSMF